MSEKLQQAANVILVLAIVVATFTIMACSAQQRADLSHAEAVIAADADTLCSLVAGGAATAETLAAANPEAAKAVAAQVGQAAAQLATKAGVSSADAAVLQADLSDPGNLAAVKAKALEIKAGIAKAQAIVAPAPGASP